MSDRTDLRRLQREFAKKAKPILDRMAKARDELRDLIGEYEDILDNADHGIQEIESALDHISEVI